MIVPNKPFNPPTALQFTTHRVRERCRLTTAPSFNISAAQSQSSPSCAQPVRTLARQPTRTRLTPIDVLATRVLEGARETRSGPPAMRTSPALACTYPDFETAVSEAFKNCSCLVEVDKTLICRCEPVGGACHQLGVSTSTPAIVRVRW